MKRFIMAFGVAWALAGATALAEEMPTAPPVAPIAAPQATIPAPYSLTVKDVEDAVTQALLAAGAGKHLAVEASGLKPNVYSSQEPVSARITGLSADKNSNRWRANLLVTSGAGAVLTAMPVAGRYQEMLTLPVLNRQLRVGDIISKDDLDTMDFPLIRTRADVVTDASAMLGQAAAHVISPRRPVRSSELAMPAIIKKSAFVQMVYRSGALEIVTSGQALVPGAKGDVIEVRNLTSRQVVRAVVEDANTVAAMAIGAEHASVE